MKINNTNFNIESIGPRTTKDGENFVILSGYDLNSDKECKIKLTEVELVEIMNKLNNLVTIRGIY